MDKWFRKIVGLVLMGIAILLLAAQVMLMLEDGFANKEGNTLGGFVFGSIIFIAAGVLLFMMGLKIFNKRDKKFEKENLIDEGQDETDLEDE